VYVGFWWRKLRGRGHFVEAGGDGRIILRWIFRKWDGGMDWIDLAEKWGQVAGSCECSKEPSVSMKSGEFLDYLIHC
jgi:hypothetical protein